MKLVRPVANGDNEVVEINLREPLGDDIQKLGFPFLVIQSDGDGDKIDIRANIIGKYIHTLGSVPPSVVSKLSAVDYTELMGEVMTFFGESLEVKPSSKT